MLTAPRPKSQLKTKKVDEEKGINLFKTRVRYSKSRLSQLMTTFKKDESMNKILSPRKSASVDFFIDSYLGLNIQTKKGKKKFTTSLVDAEFKEIISNEKLQKKKKRDYQKRFLSNRTNRTKFKAYKILKTVEEENKKFSKISKFEKEKIKQKRTFMNQGEPLDKLIDINKMIDLRKVKSNPSLFTEKTFRTSGSSFINSPKLHHQKRRENIFQYKINRKKSQGKKINLKRFQGLKKIKKIKIKNEIGTRASKESKNICGILRSYSTKLLASVKKNAKLIYHNKNSSLANKIDSMSIPLMDVNENFLVQRRLKILDSAKAVSRKLDKIEEDRMSEKKKRKRKAKSYRRNFKSKKNVKIFLDYERNALSDNFFKTNSAFQKLNQKRKSIKSGFFPKKKVPKSDVIIPLKKFEKKKSLLENFYYEENLGKKYFENEFESGDPFTDKIDIFTRKLEKTIESQKDQQFIKKAEKFRNEILHKINKKFFSKKNVTLRGIFKSYFTKPEEAEIMYKANKIYLQGGMDKRRRILLMSNDNHTDEGILEWERATGRNSVQIIRYKS